MRTLALLLLVACTGASPAPRNFVCERIAVLDPKATCQPELSDVGSGHVHTARVTQGTVTMSCAVSLGQYAMACGKLLADPAEGSGAK